MLPHSMLERADSGGSTSSSSSASDTTSISACSSLFSKTGSGGDDGGDSAERRSSFASSVFEDDDDSNDNKYSANQAIQLSSSSESTPSPGLHDHHHHQSTLPTRIDYSRSPPSSDGSSTHSHESYISTTDMQTPTAELYALSLPPISSPVNQATRDSKSSSDLGASSAQHANTATMNSSSTRSSSSNSSSTITNNATSESSPQRSNIASNSDNSMSTTRSSGNIGTNKLPPATSSEMLKFAQRVASRGVSFAYKTALPTGNSSKASTNGSSGNRPSTANGRIMSTEGFPWTARPSSSHTSISSHGSNSATYHRPSSSSSFTSSSYSGSSTRTTSASAAIAKSAKSSFITATPSSIFSSFEDCDDAEESDSSSEEEALSSLFPSTYSTNEVSNTTRTTGRSISTALHQQQIQRRDQAYAASSVKNGQSGAVLSSFEEKTLRQDGENGHSASTLSGSKSDTNGLLTSATMMYPVASTDSLALPSMREAARATPTSSSPSCKRVNEADLARVQARESPTGLDKDRQLHYQSNRNVQVSSSSSSSMSTPLSDDQHFQTPPPEAAVERSITGVEESRSLNGKDIETSSRDIEMRGGEDKVDERVHVPASSSSSFFSSSQPTSFVPTSKYGTVDESKSTNTQVRSTPSRSSSSTSSSSSLFRYEAPMAAAVALPLQLQPEPHHPVHQASHQIGAPKGVSTSSVSPAAASLSSSSAASNRAGNQHTATFTPSQPTSGSNEVASNFDSAPLDGIEQGAMLAQDAFKSTPENDDQKKGGASASTPANVTGITSNDTDGTSGSLEKMISTSTTDSSIPFSTAVMMGVATTALPPSSTLKSVSSFDHGDLSTRGISHLNSLNYHAGKGDNTYSTLSSSPLSSANAVLAGGYGASMLSRPSTAASTRPWIRDSDASSIRSSSGTSEGGSSSFDGGSGNEHQVVAEASVMSPAAPPPVPFLSTEPAPPGCKIQVEALQPDGFDIYVTLPGFTYENITLALKRNGALHILADKYDDESAGHFERMVELGESAMNCKVTAEFNGHRLKVLMRKKAGFSSRSSISSATSSASSRTTASSNGSSASAFNKNSNPHYRNSDQLNYDPAFGGILPSNSRDSSFSSSSPVHPSVGASYSPRFSPFHSSSPTPTIFGTSTDGKATN